MTSRLQKAADYGISVIFLVAFTFIPAGLMVYVVNEYTNKEKQLQFLSGVGPFMYWTTSFLWDMVRLFDKMVLIRNLRINIFFSVT